jgi:hypothetical protein
MYVEIEAVVAKIFRPDGVRTRNLKGLSREIEFDNVDEN